MNNEEITIKLQRLETDTTLQNFIAQANARYILFNTREDSDKFPKYNISDARLNLLAFRYLGLGCSFAENENLIQAREPLEKGASILEFIHGSDSNASAERNYFVLIAALSYYVSFQYSKAYILIKKIETNTTIANLISKFIQRDLQSVESMVGELVLSGDYSDEAFGNYDDEKGALKVYEITIARSLNSFINFFYTGEQFLLDYAKELLVKLKDIAEIRMEPEIWWVIRLLILIMDGFNSASVWRALAPHFEMTNKKVRQYVNSLVFMAPRGIYELFLTQRHSLPKVLNPSQKGCIVSIPTSSGKTRIAEIAILDCLLKNPDCKVLYIAPFRSLAFEIETSLDHVLGNADIEVSHLYGGSLYSKLDENAIIDAHVIIATPEKAKAMLRGNKDLMNSIKLIIVDEGHLIGADKRFIVNEVFYEELRYFIEANGGRFILLSAVLPNAEDLSEWLTQSRDNVYKENWRPSDERLGILEWQPCKAVNLKWESNDSERSSFNNGFINVEKIQPVGRQRNMRYFPSDAKEAIALTAIKLFAFGPVLIFVGIKPSVFPMAQAYLKCLREVPDYSWANQLDWKAFELACIETYGLESEWYTYAKKGILCHNANLHTDVRLPLERLMRSGRPRVIISTSTLGQGVNLGVSSVIFSTIYQNQEPISPRDFWNIAGRAGRAFIDHEGKILVRVDTDKTWQVNLVKSYFNKDKINTANSGLLQLIRTVISYAGAHGINFEMLLQLITENKLGGISDEIKVVDDTLDWIDDALLAMHDLHNPDSASSIDFSWIETHFRKSLAYIQSRRFEDFNSDDILSFVKARITGITQKVGEDRGKWNSIIRSGIPLNSDLYLEENLADMIDLVWANTTDDYGIEQKIELLKGLEAILRKTPILEDAENFDSKDADEIRDKWIKGVSFSTISQLDNAPEIITHLYSYNLPWLLNGVSKKLKNMELEDEAEKVEELSMLVETGLPSIGKIKIYQAGIRSRSAANEIGGLFSDESWKKTAKHYKRDLIYHSEYYKPQVSLNSQEWIDLLVKSSRRKHQAIDKLEAFTLRKNLATDLLVPKKINGEQYLVSLDYQVIQKMGKGDINFDALNNISGIYFRRKEDNTWQMEINNPYIEVNDKHNF